MDRIKSFAGQYCKGEMPKLGWYVMGFAGEMR